MAKATKKNAVKSIGKKVPSGVSVGSKAASKNAKKSPVKATKASATQKAIKKKTSTKDEVAPAQTIQPRSKPTAKSVGSAGRIRKSAAKKSASKPEMPKTTRAAKITDAKARATNSRERALEQARVRAMPQTAGAVLGEISWLLLNSPQHKHLFLTDLEWLVIPAVELRQFHLFRTDNLPFAFASWAHLTKDAEERLIAGERRVAPAEWNAGDRRWLIDLVSPFGPVEPLVKALREEVLKEIPFKALVRDKDGNRKVVGFGGV